MNKNQQAAIRDLAPRLAIDRYGDAAELGMSPTGPDTCPATCEYCYHQGVTILTPRTEEVEERVVEAGGAL